MNGNRCIEAGSIRSYFYVSGTALSDADLDAALKALYATSCFSDVRIERVVGVVRVHVAETPVLSRVAFEGNGRPVSAARRDR